MTNNYTVDFEKDGNSITANISCELFAVSKTFKGRKAKEKAIMWVEEQIRSTEQQVSSFANNFFSWNEN